MKERISKKQLREFGLLIGFGVPLLVGWLIPTITGHSFRIWTLWIGMSGLTLGLLAPYLLLFPYKGWMKIGYALGLVNSYIILGLVFIIVLQPIALLMRLRKYDPLRKRRKGKTTYREDRQNKQTDLTRIF